VPRVNDAHALLVIGGRPQAIAKARELGLRVVWLQHRKPVTAVAARAAEAVFMLNLRDTDQVLPVVRAAHEVFGFTRVVSLVDQAMELVGRINDEFGLRGTSREVAHRFCDKPAMRAWLRKTGFEDVAAECVGDAADLRGFAARTGYPVVLKPTDGTASRGVVVVDSPAEIDAAWRTAIALRGRDDLPFAAYYPVRAFMAEEFLDGPEYSVEAFSCDGRHSIVAITAKLFAGHIEMGHAQPAVLDPADEQTIAAYVTDFLDAMELWDGNSHTEVRLTARGPRIIEGHNRVAGGRIMDLVAAVYGIDLERYAVGWPFGLVPELPTRPVARRAAATRFLAAAPGTVVAVAGADEVREHPDVLDVEVDVGVGDVVPEVTDNFCRSGQVLVTAEDTAAAVELAERLAGRIRIEVA
jgi:biotin carboxylase